MVGQQPFGGSRASGTNDKVGSAFNLIRWLSPRAIKDNYQPPRDIAFPHMQGSAPSTAGDEICQERLPSYAGKRSLT